MQCLAAVLLPSPVAGPVLCLPGDCGACNPLVGIVTGLASGLGSGASFGPKPTVGGWTQVGFYLQLLVWGPLSLVFWFGRFGSWFGAFPPLFQTRNVSRVSCLDLAPGWFGLVRFGKTPLCFLVSVAGGPDFFVAFSLGRFACSAAASSSVRKCFTHSHPVAAYVQRTPACTPHETVRLVLSFQEKQRYSLLWSP